jgi:HK97 gp10 family phage protein
MARSGVTVRGADKLLAKLDKLAGPVARRALRNATRAGTRVLVQAVKAAAPVDEGKLKRAQSSSIVGRGLSLGGVVGADAAKLKSDNQANPDRPTNIDHLVEEGHVTPDGRFVPPAGYMRRAAAASMPAAEQAFTDRLRSEIERGAE